MRAGSRVALWERVGREAGRTPAHPGTSSTGWDTFLAAVIRAGFAISGTRPVRAALALINQTLDEVLAEQEGDFDADSRWALAWFEQYGFDAGEYGVAGTLSKAKNTSVQGMKGAGILDRKSAGGKVRLLMPSELPGDWDPATDPRLTNWGGGPPPDPRAGGRGRGRGGGAGDEAGRGGRDSTRAGVPALYRLRAEEAGAGGALVQRARAELARDHAAGAVGARRAGSARANGAGMMDEQENDIRRVVLRWCGGRCTDEPQPAVRGDANRFGRAHRVV